MSRRERALQRAGWCLWWMLSVGLSMGCAGASPEPTRAGTSSESADSPRLAHEESALGKHVLTREENLLEEGSWGWLEARPFPLLVPVPDGAGWLVVARGRWFVARHRTTDSTLAVRVWSAARRVSRDECEAELVLGRPDLRHPDGAFLLEEREGVGPAGFHGRTRVWRERAGQGVALATGAAPGRCWAIVFRTRATPAELGRRLRLATDGMLARVRWQSLEEAHAPSRAPLPFD